VTLAFPTKFIRHEVLKRYDHKFASWSAKIGKQRIDTAVLATKGLSDGSSPVQLCTGSRVVSAN